MTVAVWNANRVTKKGTSQCENDRAFILQCHAMRRCCYRAWERGSGADLLEAPLVHVVPNEPRCPPQHKEPVETAHSDVLGRFLRTAASG